MLIRDLETGTIHRYGEDCHDSLSISMDGRYLTYCNLQNGDGSRYGAYRFVMEDGKEPYRSETPDALHGECYFDIGGFGKQAVNKRLKEIVKELSESELTTFSEAIDFILSKIDE